MEIDDTHGIRYISKHTRTSAHLNNLSPPSSVHSLSLQDAAMSALISEQKLFDGDNGYEFGNTVSDNNAGEVDVFVDSDDHQIRYKTLSWQVRSAGPFPKM